MALEYDLVVHEGDSLQLLLEGDPANPESCYLLDDVQGLDGREIRETVEALPDRDGDYLGPVRQGGLSITLAGFIVGRDRADLRARERALRATLAPSSAAWRLRLKGRVGDPEDLIADVRVAAGFRSGDRAVDSRRLKAFTVALRSAAAVLYGAAERSAVILPDQETSGFTFPIRFPLRFGAVAGEAVTIVNAGDARSWPVLRLFGPLTGARVESLRTEAELSFPAAIEAGTFLEIDTATRVITLGANPDATRYALLDRDASRWWPLEPGLNPIRLRATSFSDDARLEVYWRDAYQ